ncbi:MAG TPA: GNAT family N-acetyltransferase, partial [Gemmatimonadaceae bacterium]|nr:GNAT family N-acetyltransferase [Gemmatimonadaceae bacterium]
TYGAANRPEDMAEHLARAYGARQQAREIADPAWVTLLLEAPDGMAGYAQLRRGPAPPCVPPAEPIELHRFYVDRPWHGRGAARLLMQAVLDTAVGLGAGGVWLGVWERNPRAIAFYVKSGYRDVGTTHFHVGPDRQLDRVMFREIALAARQAVTP